MYIFMRNSYGESSASQPAMISSTWSGKKKTLVLKISGEPDISCQGVRVPQ